MDFYATEENPQMTATDFYSLPPAERIAQLENAQRIYWSLPEYASEFNGADPIQTQEYWQDVIAKANAEEDAAKAAQEGRWSDMAGHLYDVYGDAAYAIPFGKVADSFMGMLRWGPRLGWRGVQSGVRVAGQPTITGSVAYRPATGAEITKNADRLLGTQQAHVTQYPVETVRMTPAGAVERVFISPFTGDIVQAIPNMR